MAIKVYVLSGTISASTAETQLDELTTPTGFKRTIQEVRPYSSQGTDVEVRLYKETDLLSVFEAENIGQYHLPYPVAEELGAGTRLRLTAINNSASDSNIKVEVVVEETTA